MMKIDDIVDDIVLLILDNHKPLKELGIVQNKVFARVKGLDEYGLWIEHPNFRLPKQVAEVPPKKMKYQEVTASVLIPWGFLASVVHFPGVEGYDFPSPFEHPIGFDV